MTFKSTWNYPSLVLNSNLRSFQGQNQTDAGKCISWTEVHGEFYCTEYMVLHLIDESICLI